MRNLLAVSFACAVGLAFGSGPDDLNGMIGGLLSSGSRMIRVPRRSYFLENAVVFGAKESGRHVSGRAYVVLNDLHDVEIDFQGARLEGREHVCMLRLARCRNVTVRNVTIDYPRQLPFTQGVIEEIGTDGSWTVRPSAGYPDVAKWGWPVQAYDGTTHELVNPMRDAFGVTSARAADGRIVIRGGKNTKAKVGDIAVGSCCTGDDHAVYAVDCEGLRFENVTVHATPGSNGFREMGGAGGNVYAHCRVMPCPAEDDPVKRALPRLRSGCHDAFNSRSVTKGPVYESCEARNHCDDDVNINGGYWMVVAAEGRKVRAVASDIYVGTFKPGPVQLMLPDGTVPVDLPEVVSCENPRPADAAVMALLKERGLVRQLLKNIRETYEFTLAREDARFAVGCVFVPQNAAGNHFAIRNCRFGPNRARGVILNASYGTIENCVFDRLSGQGIRASASCPWLEGGCCRDILIKGCTFVDCNCYIGVVLGTKRLPPASAHRNLTVRDNVFRGKAKLVIEGCTGLTLEGNQFDLGEKKGLSLVNVQR